MEELKLTMELVPNRLWKRDLKNLIRPKKEWKRIREETLLRDENRCTVCGDSGNVCHEVWYYDDEKHIQRLVKIVTLCNLCSLGTHAGLATKLGLKGKPGLYEAVVEHFCRVNGVSRAVFDAAYDEAYSQWEERNKYAWTQDFGEYSGLVPHEADRQTVVQAQHFDQE